MYNLHTTNTQMAEQRTHQHHPSKGNIPQLLILGPPVSNPTSPMT